MMHGTAYRLTQDDEHAVRFAIRRTIANWHPIPLRLKVEHVETLKRLAAHAIGCSLADLRDVELAWIDSEIAKVQEEAR